MIFPFPSEYLATFKKTVAMHEVFLRRLASHPVFRVDQHLKVFLEYDQDLCAKPRKKLAIFGGFVKSLGKTTDEILLSATVRDVNDFFENELQFLTEYHGHLREAALRTEKMTQRHKDVGDSHQKISNALTQLSTTEKGNVETFVAKTAEIFERIKVGLSSRLQMLHLLIYFLVFVIRIWRPEWPATRISSWAILYAIISEIAMLPRLC